ncbi:hypothetical protein NUW54_g12915 [Trametes sanguinea]|uniref:Uncharacterized protein n=1 Tax=Trametes sanguinea TaxID=158606 RepID=A0ACC1MRL3_9APHY|nr:hypothetical protein NUW54_g12915 [Trametes sanguinea]
MLKFEQGQVEFSTAEISNRIRLRTDSHRWCSKHVPYATLWPNFSHRCAPSVSDHPRYRHSPTPFQPEPPAAVKVTEETDATASRPYQTPVSLASYGPRDVCQASSDLAFISITVQNTIFPTI